MNVTKLSKEQTDAYTEEVLGYMKELIAGGITDARAQEISDRLDVILLASGVSQEEVDYINATFPL